MKDVKWSLVSSDRKELATSESLSNVSALRIVLSDGTQFDVELFERHVGEAMIRVRGSGFGRDGELAIVPEASNCFGIVGARRK